jgi:integrase
MILFGVHCGIRLADAAHLTWSAFNADERKLVFFESKNRKTIEIALHPEVIRWLAKRPRGIGNAPIFPSLAMHETGSAGGLSNAFSAIMAKANIAIPMGEARTGKGRTFRGKGFHSMRHTMISRMANADVSSDVRRAIAGHASDAAHRRYTHLKLETQRRAVEGMPSVGGGK